jgi:hypothetical protein
MKPYLLAVAGGYLIGNSMNETSQFGKGGEILHVVEFPDFLPETSYNDKSSIKALAKKHNVSILNYEYPNVNNNIEFNAYGTFNDLKSFTMEILDLKESDIPSYVKSMGYNSLEEIIKPGEIKIRRSIITGRR